MRGWVGLGGTGTLGWCVKGGQFAVWCMGNSAAERLWPWRLSNCMMAARPESRLVAVCVIRALGEGLWPTRCRCWRIDRL